MKSKKHFEITVEHDGTKYTFDVRGFKDVLGDCYVTNIDLNGLNIFPILETDLISKIEEKFIEAANEKQTEWI